MLTAMITITTTTILICRESKTKPETTMDHSTAETGNGTELYKYNVCISEAWEIT